LIPTENVDATWAYYFGIFSLLSFIPIFGFILGLPLGIRALMWGMRGRDYASQHPGANGGIHAWIGIILGIVSIVVSALYLILLVIVFNTRHPMPILTK
jgi:hypothetical protein